MAATLDGTARASACGCGLRYPPTAEHAEAGAVLKVRRGGAWRRVGVMRLGSDNVYDGNVRLEKRRAWRRFGQARVWSGRRTLRLRASVKGVGVSNIIVVRIGR